MLTLRKPRQGDEEAIWAILDEYRDTFLSDYTQITIPWLLDVLNSGQALVIALYDYPIGTVWFADKLDDLHAVVHCIYRPKYTKKLLRNQIFEQVVDFAFDELAIGKIKALPMETQKAAIGILRRLKFKEYPKMRSETKVKDKRIDMILFELHKQYWINAKRKLNEQRSSQTTDTKPETT